MPEDDDAENEPAFGAPLPPEDRLWRHPSEMNAEGSKQQIILVSKAANSAGHTALVAVIAGLIGAAATIAVALGTDAFVREKPGTTSKEVLSVTPPLRPNDKELDIANSVLPSIARVEAEGPNGIVSATAVVFRSDGYLITTADTVNAADKLTVYLNDGQKIEGEDVKLVGKSTDADVAVLHVNRTDLPPAVGSNDKPSIWARTIIIDASPVIRGPAIDAGLVTNDVAEASQGEAKPMYGLIQVTTRATVPARARGSVFVDESGTVIGLVTSRAEPPVQPDDPADTVGARSANTGGSVPGTIVREIVATGNALHFAVPGDFAWDIATQIVDHGKVI
jgi:S1-C subfamily serine protease